MSEKIKSAKKSGYSRIDRTDPLVELGLILKEDFGLNLNMEEINDIASSIREYTDVLMEISQREGII